MQALQNPTKVPCGHPTSQSQILGAQTHVIQVLSHQGVAKLDEDVNVGGKWVHDSGNAQARKVRQPVGGLIADVELHVRLWPDHCHVH